MQSFREKLLKFMTLSYTCSMFVSLVTEPQMQPPGMELGGHAFGSAPLAISDYRTSKIKNCKLAYS